MLKEAKERKIKTLISKKPPIWLAEGFSMKSENTGVVSVNV